MTEKTITEGPVFQNGTGKLLFTVELYTLPAYWASALINGDDSGISKREAKEIDAWLKKIQPEDGGWSEVVDTVRDEDGNGEEYFKWSNDANSLGGDVCEYVIHRHPPESAKE